MEMQRAMGWLPDVPKLKDYGEDHSEVSALLKNTQLAPRFAKAAKSKAAPAKVDLRQDFSPVEHQEEIGSCTANAAVALLEYFEKRACGTHLDASRLFVYKTSRNLLGATGDTGAYLRTAMEALVLFGAPPERYWPYDGTAPAKNTHFDAEPPAFCYAFGQNFQAIKYFRLDPNGTTPSKVLENVKAYLAAGFPSMFGFPVYNEYDSPLPGGLVPFPSPKSKYRGGHANVAAGYDDNLKIGKDQGALLVRNSWGTDWGDKGYAWLPYRYVTEGLAVDWWTLIQAKWVDTGKF